MNFLNIKRYNFYYDFFENHRISGLYSQCPDKYADFLDHSSHDERDALPHLAIVNCLPPYLGIGQEHLKKGFKCYQRTYRLGLAMDLSQSTSAREFLRNKLGKKVFKNLRQDNQRLIRDHQVTFKTYHGNIDESTCSELVEIMKGFIEARFHGKTSRHAALKRWQHYTDTIFQEINSGNASLFVFTAKERIISISLNYHYRDILCAAIISFDTEFNNYSPGRQLFYKQIEWCFENNYHIIDMGWGALDYKIKFTNAAYKYHTHVIYPEKNFGLRVLAFVLINLLMLKYFLKTKLKGKIKRPTKFFEDRWMSYSLVTS